jgi:alpha-D-ribose 1-methylphosphonate 5-triphosphate diphosphatase
VEKILSAKEEGRGSVEESISILQAAAQAESIPLASHDDDSPDRIRQYKAHGVTISEFPINIQTAVAAHFCGMDVCVGAPNIIRGGSTGKGLRAIEGIESGAVNMLCSDYYPPAILHAVFQLAKEMMSLPEAVAMATLAPAKALGLNNVGSISEGKKADIIVVGLREQVPVVTNTVVNGIQVYDVNYRTKEVVERLPAELPA